MRANAGSRVLSLSLLASIAALLACQDLPQVTLTVTRDGTGTGDIISSPPGIECGSTCSLTMLETTPVTLVATPREGAVFTGWTGGGCAGNADCVVRLVGARMTVTATFDEIPRVPLTVTKAGGGSGVVSSSPSGIDCGTDCSELYTQTEVLLVARPAVGSTFSGWSGDACVGATGTCALTVSTATTLTATFTPSKELTSFAFVTASNPDLAYDVTATIVGTNIKVTVPAGTVLTALEPTFTTNGSSVTVAGAVQTSGVTAQDFTSPVVYRVSAQDASTTDYTVTVQIAKPFVFARTNLSPGNQPLQLAIADLNGDGRPDLGVTTLGIVPPMEAASISVMLNTSAGGAAPPAFSAATKYLAGSLYVPASTRGDFAFDDINGDGRPDLVATTVASTFSVLLNTTTTNAATPSFAAATGFGMGFRNAMAIGDLNQDGKPDVVVAALSVISVFLNTTATYATTPTFAAQVDLPALSANSVAIGDVNGDGAPDLAVANEGGTVSIILSTTAANATTASFSTPVDFTSGTGGAANPHSVTVGDIDGDGRADVGVANKGVNTVSIFLNTTSTGASIPSFAPKVDVTTGSGPVCAVLADLDNDGKPDLTTANQGAGTVSVLGDLTPPNATSPVFAARQSFTTGQSPNEVAIGDVNGDGAPDLVVANQGASTISMLIAQ